MNCCCGFSFLLVQVDELFNQKQLNELNRETRNPTKILYEQSITTEIYKPQLVNQLKRKSLCPAVLKGKYKEYNVAPQPHLNVAAPLQSIRSNTITCTRK